MLRIKLKPALWGKNWLVILLSFFIYGLFILDQHDLNHITHLSDIGAFGVVWNFWGGKMIEGYPPDNYREEWIYPLAIAFIPLVLLNRDIKPLF